MRATIGMLTAIGSVLIALQPAITLRMDNPSVSAGQTATVTVRAPQGAPVTIQTSAPGVAPVATTATGADQRVALGPFTQMGDYTVTATSGGQSSAAAPLRVSWPQAEQTTVPAGRAGAAYVTAADALLESLNGARTGLSRLPAGEPTVVETKRAIDELQRQLQDIRRNAGETKATFDEYGQLLNQESNASREAKDEFARIENEIHQMLSEQARQVAQFGRDAAQPPADSCAAAMAVAAALQGQRSTANAMQNGVRDFGQRQQVTPGDGAAWARSRITNGQPLRGEGTPQSSAAAWQQMKGKIEGMVASGAAPSYGEAQRMVERATGDGGLGGYTARQCDKFTGSWSGTTHVEALDKGQPFYALVNDWSARVELAAARSTAGGARADAPLRGTLTGRASNFKVVNQLRTLYAGRPAKDIQFLTSDPTAAQQASATFVAAIEGTLRGNQMTLKILPGGVDYSGRVVGKMAAVVIPMASPVPLVQTFEVPFQGGNWQVTRAIGPSGVTERPFTVTTGGSKRMVQESYPRSLNSTGARGRFTIKVQLCSGCE